jgi:hypothetical protein
VTLACIEIHIRFYCFVVQEIAKQESKNDFIMQNCSVKKLLQTGKILQCRTAS